jgi:dolichol-phosphate mannosyltransferase
MKKKISVVLPCHNEAENLKSLFPAIIAQIPPHFDYEIIGVDDGSTDATLATIEALAWQNKRLKGLSLYRNFGHQMALWAGIAAAKGDAVITMDADFQHPPAQIPRMLNFWQAGHDLVVLKKDCPKTFFSRLLQKPGYWLWDNLSDGVLVPGASNFMLFDKRIADFLRHSSEVEVFIRGLVRLAAHKPVVISYQVGQRRFGRSSYGPRAFVNLFLAGLVSFSTKPLRLAAWAGLALGLAVGLILILDLLEVIVSGRHIIQGYLTLVFVQLLLNGFVIFYLGILGEYLGVIFKEVKKRPRYLIKRTINFSKESHLQ